MPPDEILARVHIAFLLLSSSLSRQFGSLVKEKGNETGLISSHTFALLPLLIASRKPLLSVTRKISRFDISPVYACGHVLKESQIIRQIHNKRLFNCT